MSQFQAIVFSMKNEDYYAKKQLLEYTLHILQTIMNRKKTLDADDRAFLLEYAYEEIDALLLAIPNATTYKEKDAIFEYENLVLGLITRLCPSSSEIPQNILAKIKELEKTVANERYIETFLDSIFEQESIDEADVNHLLSLVNQTTDEYQKGMLYVGLIHNRNRISIFSNEAKALMSAHLTAELKRYLGQESLTEDCISNLELAADICKHFINDTIVSLLYQVLSLRYNCVNYYAVDTLLTIGQDAPADIMLSLAQDLEYANLTYATLSKFGKQEQFPKAFSTPEYLAKSDLVHWLMYPTELGKAPDQIEYIGKIRYLFKKEEYFVFKFRSDSHTLGDDLKNKWLIGWSSDDGGTFSNFDEYALFEKSTVNATLRNIKKKLIG